MVAQITLHEKKHSELSVRQATVLGGIIFHII